MKDFLWTFSFLTVIPVNNYGGNYSPNIKKVLFLFPLVGLLIGFILASFYFFSVKIFPVAVVDALTLVIYFFITGALHLDGFADTCDGLFGGKNRESRLRIMRDSAVGSFGVVGLICLIGIRYLCFSSVESESVVAISFLSNPIIPFFSEFNGQNLVLHKCVLWLLMPLVGRWAQTFGASISTYAREGEPGTGLFIVQDSKLRYSLLASIIPLLIIYCFTGLQGILAFISVVFTSLLFVKFVRAKIGGMTGDTIGTLNEIGEIVFVGAFLL